MTSELLRSYQNARALNQAWGANTTIRNDFVLPNWIVDSDCFWYKRFTNDGWTYQLVDPEAAGNEPAFDHQALASALSKATGGAIDPKSLPLKSVTMTQSPLRVCFTAAGKHWRFDVEGAQLEQIEDVGKGRRAPFGNNPIFSPQFLPPDQQSVVAPNGGHAAFVRDHNLWLRNVETGEERALTKDGSPEFSYASLRSLGLDTAVQALWSPDSQRLFAVRRDTRKLVSRKFIKYVPDDGSLRPQLAEQKMASPGDEHVDPYHLAVVEVETGDVRAVDYPPIPLTRSGVMTAGFFRAKLGWWSKDSRHAFFVDVTRGAKAVRVVRWDTRTGATQVLFEETSDTFVKLCHEVLDPLQFTPLPDSDELIWFSERSGRAHLYLYDLATGKVKNTITQGDWLVRDVLHFDPSRRELLIRTAARDPAVSPYYADICRVNVDSGELVTLVSGPHDYIVYLVTSCRSAISSLSGDDWGDGNGVSPSGRYLVATRSRVDTVPVTVLIDRDGNEILELETAEVSRLPEDWQWPEPVKAKGADGKTDIYGTIFRPPGFSAEKKYPVVEYANGTRMFSGVPQGSFMSSQQDGAIFYYAAGIAALGFIVVCLDGRGTPLRDKAFADHGYGDPAASSDFTDRIAALRELAQRYPYMDLERVGVVSPEHPTNTIYALMKHPEFYKVCVQHCPWDPRFAPAPFEEMYNGTVDDAVLNGKIYPEHYAESLNGKLLMIVGMLSTLSVASTFRLVEALQKANKDFDMLCMPNMSHEMIGYTLRREWDYLVRNLQGVEPPKGFVMKASREIGIVV